jgi:hypothetical protein
VEGEVAFEKRFGARNQLELAVPFATRRHAPGEAGTFSGLAVGDLVVAYKRVLLHRAGAGTIVSAIGEVALPTGDTLRGGGAGTTIFEPSIAAAQLLPFNSFVQLQGGVGLPADRERVERELFARAAFGTTLTAGYGRAFSPMVEVTRTGLLRGGEDPEWDVIPQVQVTLSRRQHVKASLGVAVPVAETAARPRRLVAYVIWDWFDGGLLDGW